MAKKGVGVFVGGVLVGGAVGTLVGLLVAPRSGRETRQILKKSANALPELAEDLSTSVQLQADRFSEATLTRWQDTLTRLKEAIAAGVEAGQLEVQEIQQARQQSSSQSNLDRGGGSERPS